ncbi:MAG: hypothetical protein IJT44_01275 [Clostridia bacterium]|nr:hypothetical protein [Clostridia bacterium]
MHDFQWIVNEFLLRNLSVHLIVTLAVLAAIVVVTAVLVGVELRKNGQEGKDDHADQ